MAGGINRPKWWNRFTRIVIAIVLCSGPCSTRLYADALTDLDKAFREAYGLASSRSLADLRERVPLIVNRFGQIALYRPKVDLPDIFSMDMTLYLEARSVAHTAVALTARLAPFGLGALDTNRLDWLVTYQALLGNAIRELTDRGDVPETIKAIQLDVLGSVLGFVQRIHQRGEVDQAMLDEIGATLRPAIKKNLETAAESQLMQFREKIEQWKISYPTLAWDQTVVVIIGNHQARENYLQRQFFDWAFRDQASKQERVVYAETLTQPLPLEKEPATDAVMLLAKVMLDKTISASIFGDPLALQSDVLGDAAAEIIRKWSKP
jgi:hypothetical protein